MNTTVAKRVRNPIRAAIKLTRPASRQEIENSDEVVSRLQAEARGLMELRRNLLPIERAEAPAITKKIQGISQEIDRVQNLARFGKYAQFSLEPLRWRDAKGFPLLVVFSLNSNEFTIEAKRGYDYYARLTASLKPSSLPKEVKDAYGDVVARFKEEVKKRRKNITATTFFKGLIPPEKKVIIKEAQKEFKQVFIVAEAKGWKVKAVTPPKPRVIHDPDPLVIGYDGRNYWFITPFDVTNVEEYVQKVYCGKQAQNAEN